MKKKFIIPAICLTIFSFFNAQAENNGSSISHTVKKLAEFNEATSIIHLGVYKFNEGDPSPFVDQRKPSHEEAQFNFLPLDKEAKNSAIIQSKKDKTIFL